MIGNIQCVERASVADSQMGDAALAEIYRSHAPGLLRFFARRAERQDLGDLVNESFLRFATAQAKCPTKVENPAAYLTRIAINLLRDRARTAARRSFARHVSVDDVPIAGDDPVAQLEARDQIDRVQKALSRFNPKTRAVFLACRLDGLSHKEIAARTGLSGSGVEHHMAKAIRHLDRIRKHG